MGESKNVGGRLAAFYLARGADAEYRAKLIAFRNSYVRFRPGIDHKLVIIWKGFSNATELGAAREMFAKVDHEEVYTSDDSFDIGAYFDAVSQVGYEHVCLLNTSSEINSEDWLGKMVANYRLPSVAVVGASGSYEAPQYEGINARTFPNPHIRSNALLIGRREFLAMHPGCRTTSKLSVHLLEHGSGNITQRILSVGRMALVVGKDGRGYAPPWWPTSRTFRQGTQRNLLIHDNQTRWFDKVPVNEKRHLFRLAWGSGRVAYELGNGRRE
jgi:hypothetical protein